jgi:hypothetical protein
VLELGQRGGQALEDLAHKSEWNEESVGAKAMRLRRPVRQLAFKRLRSVREPRKPEKREELSSRIYGRPDALSRKFCEASLQRPNMGDTPGVSSLTPHEKGADQDGVNEGTACRVRVGCADRQPPHR